MAPAEFSIPVHDLDAAGRHVRMPVRPGWLRGALEGTGVGAAGPDGLLDVRVSKSGTDVVVRGTLSAELTVPCARCLEPARIGVHEELSVLAVPSAEARRRDSHAKSEEEEEDEGAAEQADVIPYDGDTLVLDDLVRDELLLGIPMIPLCSEQCAGIRHEDQHEDASEAHIDPRLRPLLSLKSKT